MNLGRQALQDSRKLQRFDFDKHTYTIRRNLMIISSLAIASTFISPIVSTGKYEINIGIVKGTIDNPILLYIFLAISCIYYLIWFYIHCKRLVINNYKSILHSFDQALVLSNAKRNYTKIMKTQGLPEFSLNGNLKVTANLNENFIQRYQGQIVDLENSALFEIETVDNGKKLSYTHIYSDIDLEYVNAHVDQYWRTRKEEAFITLLPIGYSIIAISLIGLHIYVLLQS